MRRGDEEAKLAAGKGRHPVPELAPDRCVPDGPVRSTGDGDDPEITDLHRMAGRLRARGDRPRAGAADFSPPARVKVAGQCPGQFWPIR